MAIPSSSTAGAGLQFGSGGGSALLATAGADGAVRVWRGGDGKLLQSIESAHYRWVFPTACPLPASVLQNLFLLGLRTTVPPINHRLLMFNKTVFFWWSPSAMQLAPQQCRQPAFLL